MSDIQVKTEEATTTIDWAALVEEVEIDGEIRRGVRLRALVDLGLYGKFQDAEKALQNADLVFFTLTVKNAGRGRPSKDYLLEGIRSVQKFCARAKTDVGNQILGVIIDHHDEFQALLEGDRGAWERLRGHAQKQLTVEEEIAKLEGELESLRQLRPSTAITLAINEMRVEISELKAGQRFDRLESSIGRIASVTTNTLPAPKGGEVPKVSPRKAIDIIVKQVAAARIENLELDGVKVSKSVRSEYHAEVRRELYKEFSARSGIDLYRRAKNANKLRADKGLKSKLSKMDVADQQGFIDELYAVAFELHRRVVEKFRIDDDEEMFDEDGLLLM